MKITIKETQNPNILKFEFPDFITQNESFEFKNIDDAKNSPLSQQLFYLPFVKTVYISGNFVAIEKYSIVEWLDVQEDVAEQIENFVNKGGIIVLPNDKTQIIKVAEHPSLLKQIGNDIITTDGTTLLGADNKAGLAEIMDAANHLMKHPEIKHGTIRILFTPDEEIGRGADKADMKKLAADYGYTIDGEISRNRRDKCCNY